jgi:hypothetical protein
MIPHVLRSLRRGCWSNTARKIWDFGLGPSNRFGATLPLSDFEDQDGIIAVIGDYKSPLPHPRYICAGQFRRVFGPTIKVNGGDIAFAL